MRMIAAVGLIVGAAMMTAPLWGPRLGLGVNLDVAQSATVPTSLPGARVMPAGDATGGVLAALGRAWDSVGAPAVPGGRMGAVAGPMADGMLSGGMVAVDDPDTAVSDICRGIVAAGHMTEQDCRAQMGVLMQEIAGPQGMDMGMGEVEQAMQGIRRFGPTTARSRHPGAKFVKVQK
ncbi:MAG: hypothetical protein ACK4GO_14055 [Gemmobacter sp.]